MRDDFNFLLQVVGLYWLIRGLAHCVTYALRWWRGDYIRLGNLTYEQKARVSLAVQNAIRQELVTRQVVKDAEVKWPEMIGE